MMMKIIPLVAVMALLAGAALPENAKSTAGLPGDVNLDGVINVLDVQQGINHDLAGTASAEADLDGNGQVDVRDVQNLVNSALGTGGVFQVVKGQAPQTPLATGWKVVAISMQGLMVQASLPASGQFTLALRAGGGWRIGIIDPTKHVAVEPDFALGSRQSHTLALPALSIGKSLDLGTLPNGLNLPIVSDLQPLLAGVMDALPTTDANNNGIPDFLQPLFDALIAQLSAQLKMLPPDKATLDTSLLQTLTNLFQDQSSSLTHPNLLDSNNDGTPDFIEPLLTALGQQLTPLFGSQIMNCVTQALPAWLAGLNMALVTDANKNGIPDFLESHLVVPASSGDQGLHATSAPDLLKDANNNGIPDFLESAGISADDTDGDGIPDSIDLDKDNDGVPDYADAYPLDPSRA
jgi:hypothetical protein